MNPSLRPADLRSLLQLPFTEEQLAAATAPLEPAVIVAGAGSGKTSVMAARVVWLVATGQVAPDRVLGLTFTNKAAAELSSRIRASLQRASTALHAASGAAAGQSAGGPPHGAELESEPVVSTYHAFAGRLVTDHGLRLGIEPHSRLLADATRYQLAARVLRRRRRPIHHLTQPLRMLVGDLIELEAELSEHLVQSSEVAAFDQRWLDRLERARSGANRRGHLADLEKLMNVARRRIELCELVDDYRAAKRDLDAVDFGDQVALATRLAEGSPPVGAVERGAAAVVLLDEYQDTSVAQRRLLAALFGCGHPVIAVGDPCQAIYGWRGASVANLDHFPEHFRRADGSLAATFSLSVNQRSGGRLLDLANTVAAGLRLRHRVVELRPRPAAASSGETVVALHDTWADEIRWLADRLSAQIESGTSPGECAVLVRSRSDFSSIHAGLIARGLPVEVVGLGGLLSLPEVADVVATLQVLDEPTANAALIRLLTGPRFRLGARDLAALGRRARQLLYPAGLRPEVSASAGAAIAFDPGGDITERALIDAVAGVDPCDVTALSDALDDLGVPGEYGLSAEAARRCTLLAGELRRLRRHLDDPLLDLLQRVISAIGLDVETSASPQAEASRRRDALSSFLDVAAGFIDLDGQSSLTAFLAFLDAAQEHERGLDSSTPSGADSIQLMTVHKAKGLEWDVVAVPDLCRTVFPVSVVRSKWTTDPAVLPHALRGDASSLPECANPDTESLQRFKADCDDHLRREEDRLGYVAFTRARRMLLGSGHWWGPTQKRSRGPSPFLDALRDHCAAGPAGNGTIDCWAEPPPPEVENPQLAELGKVTWPHDYDADSWARRRHAAELVRAACSTRAGQQPEDVPGAEDVAGAEGVPGALPEGLTGSERALLASLDRDTELLVAELTRRRSGVREVALPTSLSATQVLRLRSDPDGLARELARPLPRPPGLGARRGTRFHAWVEALFDQRPLLDPDDLPGAEDWAEGEDADLAALQEAFLAGPYAARRPHAVEASFALALAGRIVRGRIDAVYDLGGGRWEVIDWKTGREPADALQLAIYRLAWADLTGVPPEQVDAAFLYVLEGRQDRPPLFSRDEVAALLDGRISPSPSSAPVR